MRLVCMGDSFTEGMSDDLRPDGYPIGWSDRVAEALAREERRVGSSASYANLAVRGKLLDQVVTEQVPIAAGLHPTIATFHAGPNDVLRRGTDFADLQARYASAVQQVAEVSDHVVLFTSIGRAGGTGRLAQLLADRFARFNENVRAVGLRVGATVVDLEPVHALSDRRLWDEDRLHLNASGHRHVTAAVLEALGHRDPTALDGPVGWWRVPLPPAPPSSLAHDVAVDIAWVRGHLVPWVGRRLRGRSSGDGRLPKDPVLRDLS
jgi:lysophospholipase L1-like esterase